MSIHHELQDFVVSSSAKSVQCVAHASGAMIEPAFVDLARRVVARQIRNGGASVRTIALELGTSGRTLQRRLHSHGTSLQHLIASVRCEIAVQLLMGACRPASEVAEVLGFSAPSAFHRAFKRWTGATPGEYRNRLSGYRATDFRARA